MSKYAPSKYEGPCTEVVNVPDRSNIEFYVIDVLVDLLAESN